MTRSRSTALRPAGFSANNYKVRIRCKQPDYASWQAVANGMTRNEVRDLLGRPLADPYSSPMPRVDDPYYYYGYIELPMMPHVRTYRFAVGFDENGKVFTKIDPFGGIFSVDGTPSIPTIFTPSKLALFDHYPRIVDMRWHPVSGKYPIKYEIEMGRAMEVTGPFIDEIIETELPFPYFVAQFCGSQPGRFRVRGRNALGAGEWSEFRYFDFSLQGSKMN